MNKDFNKRTDNASRLVLGIALFALTAMTHAASVDKTSSTGSDRLSGESASAIGRAINSQEIQVNRYTTLANAPDETDQFPLAVTAKIHFPRGYVTTVGDAVKYLLIRTGYELAPLAQMDEYVKRVFALRLPESNRIMGPYRVDAMLQALMGQAFALNVDQSLRLVSYATKAPTIGSGAAIPPVDTTINKPDGSSVIKPAERQAEAEVGRDGSTQKVAASQNATQP